MRFKARKNLLNSDEVSEEIKSWGPFLGTLFLCIPVIGWILLCFSPWRHYELLDNRKYKLEGDAKKTAEKLVKILDDLKAEEEHMKREVKEIKDSGRTHRGLSAEYDKKIPFSKWFLGKNVDFDKPDGEWRKYLNPKLFGKAKGQPTGLREQVGAPDQPRANRTAYTLKDFEPFKRSLEFGDEFDHVMTFREPEKNKGSKSSRKKRPGESHEEHMARLAEMDRDKNH